MIPAGYSSDTLVDVGPHRRPYRKHFLGKTEFIVDSRYTHLKPIGRGAYGLVAAAEDSLTGRKVAIKKVSRVFQDLIDAKRILREIKLLRHLGAHENIIEITDIMTGPPHTEDFHTLYIVTQLFECDLERIISSSQKLTDQHAQYFIYQVLRGLLYIHSARVLHRDLKPSNLLVNSNCDLAICDFGLARGVSDTGETKLTEYVVTRWYRAPELLCEADMYGTPVDVWAVGCILAEIFGRKPLFKGSSTREQLELIIRILGAPTAADMRNVTAPGAMETIRRLGPVAKVPFDQLFPGANPLGLDLLSRMLTFDQFQRITVEECLRHPYLAELHSRAYEPVCEKPFDWTYEKDYPDEMPQPLLQRLMYQEMLSLQSMQAAIGLPLHLTAAEAEALRAAAAAAAAPGSVGGAGATGVAAPAGPTTGPVSGEHTKVPPYHSSAAAAGGPVEDGMS